MAIEGIKSYYEERKKKLNVLSEAECEKILNASFSIYEKTGYWVKSAEAREILVAAGAVCEGEIVKIPRELVAKCVTTAAKDFKVYDRFGNLKMHANGNNSFFGLGPTNPNFDDFYTGERRPARRNDVTNAAIVADACPNIDFLMGLAQITDCNLKISDVYEGYEMLTNSTKPAIVWGIEVDGLETQVKMAEVIAGGHDKLVEKPFLILFPGCPDTPLSINERVFEELKYCAKSKLPFIWMGGGQLGISSPVTIAGTLALNMCDMLIGVILSQLINPGCTVITGYGVLTVDMKSMLSAYGSAEHCLGEGSCADIMHYLGLPNIQTAGVTDSKLPDEQSAIETSMNVMITMLAGGNLVHDVGFIDSAMSGSLEQIVMSDEIIGYAKRVCRGIEINEETLALDVIDEIGPGGNFFMHDHTLDNFREELFFPTLFDHSPYGIWKTTKKDFRTRTHEKTAVILETHRAPELPTEVKDKVDRILRDAEEKHS